jgi:hypothetical protein
MRMYFGLEMLIKAGEVNANSSSPRLRVNENRYFPDPRFSIVFGLPTLRHQRLTADTGPTQCLPREMANQPAGFQTLVLAGYKHACYRNPDPTVIIKANLSA